MLHLPSAKDLLVGAAIAASSIGLSDAAAAQESAGDVLTRESVTSVERFSGALTECLPPALDGPIRWEGIHSTGDYAKRRNAMPLFLGAAGALTGALLGLVSSPYPEEALKNAGKRAAIGAALLGVPGAMFAPEVPKILEFRTTVANVCSAEGAHEESHRSGKHTVTEGPFFTELLSIPETNLLLAANSKGAPFIPGQKIVARFLLDNDNRIVAWYGYPDAR